MPAAAAHQPLIDHAAQVFARSRTDFIPDASTICLLIGRASPEAIWIIGAWVRDMDGVFAVPRT